MDTKTQKSAQDVTLRDILNHFEPMNSFSVVSKIKPGVSRA